MHNDVIHLIGFARFIVYDSVDISPLVRCVQRSKELKIMDEEAKSKTKMEQDDIDKV